MAMISTAIPLSQLTVGLLEEKEVSRQDQQHPVIVTEEAIEDDKKAEYGDSFSTFRPKTRRSMIVIGGLGVVCGISVSAFTSFAATVLNYITTRETSIQIGYYWLLNSIIVLGHVVYYTVCLSSIIHLLVLLFGRACGKQQQQCSKNIPDYYSDFHSFLRTVLFQGGFFAGITICIWTIQMLYKDEQQTDSHQQLVTFAAAFADRILMVSVISCCFLKPKEGGSSDEEDSDDEESQKFR